MRDAYLFDMDGTMTDVSSIRHHLVGADRNFHKFHRASVDCPPHPEVVGAAVEAHRAGIAVIICTARVETYWPETQFWLRHHLPVPYDAIYMRRKGDYRKDGIIKRELLGEMREDGFNVVRAWDDNPAVVAVWESEGIEVTVVPGWTEI
jgi:hypothetical protein